MKNVIYSTTRQWNPGDEFILMGVINILNEVIGEHNPIIYNRNPDIRPEIGQVYLRKKDNKYSGLVRNDYIRMGFLDNSIKFDTDCSFADLAVFAGTPEWWDMRCENFYQHIIENGLPTVCVGLGSIDKLAPYIKEVLAKSEYISFRDEKFIHDDELKGLKVKALACPAMQCVKIGNEKIIPEVKTIGLGFAVDEAHSIKWNCIPDDVYERLKSLYLEFIKRYKDKYKINVICHYIDELPEANRLFKDTGVDVLYSYDSKDYVDIYKKCDIVISTRVHGCGIASSLGIPSLSIIHDERGTTTLSFLSQVIDIHKSEKEIFDTFEKMVTDVAVQNKKIIEYKKNVFGQYVKDLSEVINFDRVEYSKYQFTNDEAEADRFMANIMGRNLDQKGKSKLKLKIILCSIVENITFGNLRAVFNKKKNKYIEKYL